MNHILKILAYGLGGFVLLIGSFVTFSALTGTPMHDMKGVGKLFPEQVVALEGESTMLPDVEEEIQQDRRSPRQLFESAATPLSSFMLADPFSAEELADLRLVRVSEHFRVVALGLPVPRYVGNPLDPPLRSRFQAYDLRPSAVPFKVGRGPTIVRTCERCVCGAWRMEGWKDRVAR